MYSRFASRVSHASSRWARQVPSSITWSRGIHSRKPLSYPIENGLGDFLPPEALGVIAVEYQEGLLNRLNDEVRGTPLENKSVVQSIIDSSMDPNKVKTFNYASEALNNSYFLESMKPPRADAKTHEDRISVPLHTTIKSNFGDLEQLKSTFGATVEGMFSPGYVWLVSDQAGSLAVFPTFGTGTLLVASRKPAIEGDAATVAIGELPGGGLPPSNTESATSSPTSPSSGSSHQVPPLSPSTPSRAYSTSASSIPMPNFTPSSIHDPMASRTPRQSPKTATDPTLSGKHLYPLFCISVHEHAWLSAGYGVWGKEEYVKRFWSVVNWDAASKTYARYAAASATYQNP